MNINETLLKYIESVKDAETRDIIYQNKLQLILGKHLNILTKNKYHKKRIATEGNSFF